MSVPSPLSQHRSGKAPHASPVAPLVVLVVTAAAAGAAIAAAPENARTWTVASALGAWLCVAVTVVVSTSLIRRARRSAASQVGEVGQIRSQLAQQAAESAHLVNVTLPAVAARLRDGTSAQDALTGVTQPSDPQLRKVLHSFTTMVEQDVKSAAALDNERRQAQQELADTAAELERLTKETLPDAMAKLREGVSADTIFAEVGWPQIPLLRVPAESFIRELAHSERRAAAAQSASAKALSRVQAKAVSMLADLRDMQERHGEEVFGDLLKLDHSTSQLGLMTDRLALLMGGRSSRAWNKPIVMESILRGAVGRIAAYRRVRLHCSTNAAVSGFAAEGVMHLLAELMDNAANFSPPIDEVHVYVEQRSAGIVVTIEDSGLKMADAAMRRAEASVAGRMTDLASLQGTRLGLAVVGRLAVKYGISVNYRPSSRGGTGVVVLLPPQLLAQQRDAAQRLTAPRPSAAAPTPAPAPAETAPPAVPEPAPAEVTRPAATVRPTAGSELPEPGAGRRPADATPNGLPVRAPGRTMAEADREREQRRASASATAQDGTRAEGRSARRDAGSLFGSFHRGRQSGTGDTGSWARPASDAAPEPPADS
ncbi:ATP-binding protein [Streptomyces bluensis]|uniref:ATP-binding protein n=1 Tax=Streptomyces bluensis TaxID=33897 RepID=UPI00167A5506|nr:ATP-binding protein [Streptomyces bluensis]